MIDPRSDTWRAIRAHAEHEIEAARARLEHPGDTSADIDRGQIKALRAVLKLAEPGKEMTDTSNHYV